MQLSLKKILDFWLGGALVVLLYIPVRIAGKILKRNHSLENLRHIALIKLLGGGSLFMALPALEEIKRKHPKTMLSIVCSPAIRPFAESLEVFDSIQVLDDKMPGKLILSSLQTLFWLMTQVDLTIDLEVHSRLTTVFTTLSMVKNRLGLIGQNSLWRRRIYTHSLYINPFKSIYDSYDALAIILGSKRLDIETSRKKWSERFQKYSMPAQLQNLEAESYIALGFGCSDLALERMMSTQEAKELIEGLASLGRPLLFLGGAKERIWVEVVCLGLSEHAKSAMKIYNLCGDLSLNESLVVLSRAHAFVGIDSALMHFARYFSISTVGFWGPTSPLGLIRPLPIAELQIYKDIACSPCVHLTEFPPCRGQNICMNHRGSFSRVYEFLREPKRAPIAIPNHKSDMWIYGPDEHLPRGFQVEAVYS
jgi:ADP-heptose:LPS heptosyltransferase